MDENPQGFSIFAINLCWEISLHQIYAACKPFGVIVEFNNYYEKVLISFVRSIHTDRLKPMHILCIDNEEFDLKWMHDDLPIFPHQQLPELEYNQQSPQNILDMLNDDCLREIFVNLPELDRCAVAHVCQRFRDVVLGIKPKHIELNDVFCTNPLWKIERFFRIFGKSIQTAHIIDRYRCADIVLTFLSRYCENLVEVDCAADLRSTTMNEVAALFPRLRRVSLRHGGTADMVFQPNDEIESIRVDAVAHLPPIHFPKLRELQFCIMDVFCIIHMPSIERFFALNSQIEKLEIDHARDFPISIILANLPLLQELRPSWLRINADLIKTMGQLKHLHTLKLLVLKGDIGKMFGAFVENGIHLRHLELRPGRAIPISYDVDILAQMKSLEYLKIYYLSDDQLVRLVGNCTSLKEIKFESGDITPRGIRDALRRAVSLEKVTLYVDFGTHRSRIIVDQSNEIDAIGELRAKKRIDIRADFTIHVEADGDDEPEILQGIRQILDRHSDWIKKNECLW